MASNDQARNFNSAEEDKEKESFRGRVGSKAQMCLHKILHTIKIIPPPSPPPPPPPHPLRENQDRPSSSNGSQSKRGSFHIDLNLTSCPSLLAQKKLEFPVAAHSGAESESTVVEKSYGNQMNYDAGQGDHYCDDRVNEKEKISQKEVFNEKQENVFTRDNRGLELLMAAAKVVTGGEFGASDDEGGEKKKNSAPTESIQRNRPQRQRLSRSRPRSPINVEEEDGKMEEDDVTLSPVVRTKRGRAQVLPYKYRDSILEPLTPLSRPNRSSTPVPTKRRSR